MGTQVGRKMEILEQVVCLEEPRTLLERKEDG